MIRSTHTLPPTGLRAIRNSRTRIFGTGRDPVFGTTASPRDWLRRDPATSGAGEPRLIRRDWLDRLQPTLTRRPE